MSFYTTSRKPRRTLGLLPSTELSIGKDDSSTVQAGEIEAMTVQMPAETMQSRAVVEGGAILAQDEPEVMRSSGGAAAESARKLAGSICWSCAFAAAAGVGIGALVARRLG